MTAPNESVFSPRLWTHDSLTKRELFAAMAMQGLCANVQFQLACGQIAAQKGSHVADEIALSANDMADALIAELNKAP